ncbi:VOC family protein [Variovorax sp. J22P271]|uniref:VOC family protein n=1 Tax=Variovorax davisae TaxID=3053515 RepID=UPI00257923E0|nr:VOC family protein [Variovorax sp. J22P271]MDM0037124.1 VOC family protein [Variovorax sp. J22P271]
MQVQSYLFFDGRCEEALAFYRKAVGAQVTMLMRFKESPDPIPADKVPPGSDDKVMHASFNIGETMLMASDGFAKGQAAFKGFALSLSAADEAEARRLFDALGEGGQVQMPMGKTFWSPAFGMVEDRFGILWMVQVPAPM